MLKSESTRSFATFHYSVIFEFLQIPRSLTSNIYSRFPARMLKSLVASRSKFEGALWVQNTTISPIITLKYVFI